MKKLFVFIFLIGCTQSVSSVPSAPPRVTKIQIGQNVEIYTIDNHEYIFIGKYYPKGAGGIVHKEDCKHPKH